MRPVSIISFFIFLAVQISTILPAKYSGPDAS